MVSPNNQWNNPPYRPAHPEPWERGNWHEWVAWYPVKVNDKVKWLTKVYRRKKSLLEQICGEGVYTYGTLFDILKD